MGELRIETTAGGSAAAGAKGRGSRADDGASVVFRCVVPTATGRKEISLNLRRHDQE
jgi:hypothetical protein